MNSCRSCKHVEITLDMFVDFYPPPRVYLCANKDVRDAHLDQFDVRGVLINENFPLCEEVRHGRVSCPYFKRRCWFRMLRDPYNSIP